MLWYRMATIMLLGTMTSACSPAGLHAEDVGAPRLFSALVAAPPTVDGMVDDEEWQAAIPVVVQARRVLPPNDEDRIPVSISSVRTDSAIYFLVTWPDETESIAHKPWVWDATDNAYVQGSEREDMLALAFEHTGPFTADMLSGNEAIWDVWHWKAHRTNPQGYATDKTHHYTGQEPEGKARRYDTPAGEIWIARPEDTGSSVEMKQPAPTDFQGERLPQYLPATPDGSAADIRARGTWRNGTWTLELSRRLDTGNPDDTSFDPTRSYQMAVATFDHTGSMDRASQVIVLSFGEKLSQYGFEGELIGSIPTGFTAALTGRGRPGNWEVRADARAFSGNNVVVQTDPDPTNYRFPILVSDAVNARNLDVSVRFKPISGNVDQAAGLVWRYTDRNNYYVARANALEDNVVLYKVVNGRREDLPLKGVGRTYGVDKEVAREIWSSLRVVAIGSLFEVYLNGEKLYEVEDDALTGPGRAGLWTKADSVTAFDNLLIGVYAH